jgi:hypothetical protein
MTRQHNNTISNTKRICERPLSHKGNHPNQHQCAKGNHLALATYLQATACKLAGHFHVVCKRHAHAGHLCAQINAPLLLVMLQLMLAY